MRMVPDLRPRQVNPLGLGLAMAMITACGGPLPIEYETERLRIGTDLDYPLCGGNLASFERTMTVVQDDLGIHSDGIIEVYLWDGAGWEAERIGEGLCSGFEAPHGCFKLTAGGPRIWATTSSIYHELVHSVTWTPKLDNFFSEGIADMYAGDVSRFGMRDPSENLGVPRDMLDSVTATHFVRWLRERFGNEKLGALLLRGGAGIDEFKAVYGMSFESAEALYLEEAPAVYAPLGGCKESTMPHHSMSGSWYEEVELDCGSQDTFSGPGGLFVRRSFDIETGGRYSITTNGGWLDIYRCTEGAIDDVPSPKDVPLIDVPADYMGFSSPAYRYLVGGDVHDLELSPGRHIVSIGIYGHAPGSAELAVWPSIGPRPVGPT